MKSHHEVPAHPHGHEHPHEHKHHVHHMKEHHEGGHVHHSEHYKEHAAGHELHHHEIEHLHKHQKHMAHGGKVHHKHHKQEPIMARHKVKRYSGEDGISDVQDNDGMDSSITPKRVNINNPDSYQMPMPLSPEDAAVNASNASIVVPT